MSKTAYHAPALDKGLTILEFMAGKTEPFTIAEIAKALGKSKTEIYRVLITLETRGYIRRDERDGRYEMTGFLFDLGMRHPPRRNLIEIAMPHMHALSRRTNQSCHISLFSQDAVVAVARAESEAAIGFSVKLGFRVPMPYSTSGRLLYAFQSRHQQAVWLNMMRQDRAERLAVRAFLAEVEIAARQGYLMEQSFMTAGITDICVPIFNRNSGHAVACLAIPFLSHRFFQVGIGDILPLMQEAAARISADIG
ncbi:MAG TPA: IclR family transcriptional regulator [Asticcacaulis sp.]|nr:IclR family transcriptional regulator [Asticcacaulis sp.]